MLNAISFYSLITTINYLLGYVFYKGKLLLELYKNFVFSLLTL